MLKEISIASALLLGGACDSFSSKQASTPTPEPSSFGMPTLAPSRESAQIAAREIYLPDFPVKTEDEKMALSFTQMVFAADEKRVGELGFPGLAETVGKTINQGCQVGVIGKVSEDSQNEVKTVTISVVEDCNKGPQALTVEVTERNLGGKTAVIGFDIHK
ncbi:MAG TPA: hypothetical protein VFA93_00210 [Patescibacteria group bacterium]|nr:hypothetical protein [Patescibacteria group bacterium]